ncbi:alpha-glycosidase [Paenibacillus sp. FSL H8-0548]|uniref:alpha-glycosidase n=1 Tax=Paenibacillus sp. FSL H8-0548 TaxID=1920422 RepID=UPI00096CDB23|nr:alpha-glycosidase [Paenibacillus sp. FSL H8-0548]OMF21329.1 alpha-glycosidase [Paenibacillus sp. FSL H8-0548]
MFKECLHHSPDLKWAYAYDCDSFHLRLRTKRDDVEEAVAVTGDKYDWDQHSLDVQMVKIAADSLFDYWEAVIKPEFQRFSYCFRVHSGDEILWLTENGIFEEQPTPVDGYFEVPYIHAIDLFDAPKWAKDAIFYQIIPDRFANGDLNNDPESIKTWGEAPSGEDHFGGDLQGIMDNLNHLTDLGINAIYLTPVFTAPSNHKYDTIDYKHIDPHFGDAELLKKLVSACHELKIRVILDAVFNHTSEQFPPFQDVLKKGEGSKYKDWFHLKGLPVEVKDGMANYATFGFYGNMPKLNTANPEVKQYLLDIAVYWIKEADIDGWRLDVANEIDHAFWHEFRAAVKAAKPDAFIIGEVWGNSLNWLHGDEFDSAMNYPVTDRILNFFSSSEGAASDFADEINRLLMRYPQQTNEALFNLLSSHDTPRAATRLDGNTLRLKLAVVFMLTYMGIPCIYYGDEIGMDGGDDPDCRKCMEWDRDRQDRQLFDFYQLLIKLRKSHPALRDGRFRFLHADNEKKTLIYERLNASEHFTIWINNSEEAVTLTHPMQANDWRDALTNDEAATFEEQLQIELKPLDFRILYRNI